MLFVKLFNWAPVVEAASTCILLYCSKWIFWNVKQLPFVPMASTGNVLVLTLVWMKTTWVSSRNIFKLKLLLLSFLPISMDSPGKYFLFVFLVALNEIQILSKSRLVLYSYFIWKFLQRFKVIIKYYPVSTDIDLNWKLFNNEWQKQNSSKTKREKKHQKPYRYHFLCTHDKIDWAKKKEERNLPKNKHQHIMYLRFYFFFIQVWNENLKLKSSSEELSQIKMDIFKLDSNLYCFHERLQS